MDEIHARLVRELDSYIGFFRRRQEIENDYVEALKKLARANDRTQEDDLSAEVPTTWRRAFAAVRTAVEDEARAHRSTADGLGQLLTRLATFRDDRDRIRRRIKEDLRSTATEHGDYRNVVQRLRKAYERKVEELQHHEEAEAARTEPDGASAAAGGTPAGGRTPVLPASQASGAGTEKTAWPPEHWNIVDSPNHRRSNSAASSRAGTGTGGAGSSASDVESPPTNATSPTLSPVFVSGATSSSAVPPSAFRDPPTAKSSVFEAIAKRDWSNDKQRVNSIVRAVGSLAKGADTSGAPKSARSRQYGSRLKRDAEQADRDYRAGIFQLETLRLQKSRVQTSARESLHEFAHDLSSNLKTTFARKLDEQALLGDAHVAIAHHVQTDVERIDPLQDAVDFCSQVEQPVPTDPPLYYVNVFVGECKSLLFGVGLQDYYAKHPGVLVPLIVQRCISHIEEHGLDSEGLYRVSPRQTSLQHLATRMEKEESAFEFGPNDDVPAVAGLLKLYLRQLPYPLFPFSSADRRAFTSEYASSPETALANLSRRIRRLSTPQQATLKAVCQHLSRVAEHEEANKMGTSNLALIFTSVIFGEDDAATLETALQGTKDNVMEVLIKLQAPLFRDLPLDPGVRSREGSGAIQPPRPRSAIPSPSRLSHAIERARSDDPPSPPPEGNGAGNGEAAESIDAVFALYSQAADLGATTLATSQEEHAPSLPTAHIPPSPLPPSRASHSRHPTPPPRNSSPLQAHRQDSFDGPEPPLSAAHGRRDPSL